MLCTLLDAGGKKTPGYGLAAHIGPDHGPVANRLFAVTIYNHAVYEVSADAFDITSTAPQEGAIVRVSADGKLAALPFYRGPGRAVGVEPWPCGPMVGGAQTAVG